MLQSFNGCFELCWRILAWYLQEAFVERKYLCLVMAYCDSGDLKARIERAAKRRAWGACSSFTAECLGSGFGFNFCLSLRWCCHWSQENCSRSKPSWIGSSKWRSHSTTCTTGKFCTGTCPVVWTCAYTCITPGTLLLQRHQAAEYFPDRKQQNSQARGLWCHARAERHTGDGADSGGHPFSLA